MLSVEVTQGSLEGVQPSQLHVSVRGQDEDAIATGVPREVLQQVECGTVGPVEIVQQECYGNPLRHCLDEVGYRSEQALLLFFTLGAGGLHPGL
jgi:hypothetical protein